MKRAAPDTSTEWIDPARLVSQRYFNVFRLLLAGIFLVLGEPLSLGKDAPIVFVITIFSYLAVVLAFGFPDAIVRLGLNRVVTIQLVCDMLMLGVVMWSSGGFASGMSLLVVAYLAAGGLVAEGRMTLFAAAMATAFLLGDNVWRVFSPHATPSDFTQVGMACMSFFMVALIARLLARRVRENASLALVRGEALGRQEAVNEKIIEDMQDGVIVLSPDGRVRRSNPRASELLGTQLMDNMLLADVDGTLLMYGNAADFGDVVQRFGPGGRMLRYRRVQADPLYGSRQSGDILIYLRDFEEVQNQVQQVKLAALGRLTASMAHEIRNPLNAIHQSTDLLAEDMDDSPVHQRLIRIMRDNTQRIERLIREVLALGRFDRRLGEAISLKPFIDALIAELALESEAERKIYETSIDGNRVMTFDRLHLHQILTNLLGNARRYCSGKPGAIRLFTEGGPRFTRLHIVDDGNGVAAADRAKMFEPFFTRDPKGTGLGLYIARELAEANGAHLSYAGNSPGAHFILSGLPEADPAAAHQEQDNAAAGRTGH